MKAEKIKFAKTMAVFMIVTAALFLAVSLAYSQFVIKQKNIYKSEMQFKQYNNGSISILFLGDSHPARAVNPEYIPGSFNFAVPSETYEQSYYKLRRILAEQDSIKVIVLPLDIHSFSDYRSNVYFDKWYWTKYLNTEELAKVTNSSAAKVHIQKAFPFIGNGNDFFTIIGTKKTEVVAGWQKETLIFTSSSNITGFAVNRAHDQFKSYPEIINRNLFLHFMKTLELAKRYNKTVILIQYPVSLQYEDAVAQMSIDRSRFYSTIMSYVLKYENTIILDYHNSFDNLTLFSDPDHLNIYGAEIFSRELNTEIQKWV